MAYPVEASFDSHALTASDVWTRCLNIIKADVSTLSFKTWFQPIVPVKLSETELTVQVPSQFFYDWLDEHYNTLIRNAIVSVLGESAQLFYFVGSEAGQSEAVVSEKPAEVPAPADIAHAPFHPHVAMRNENLQSISSNLNPRYIFDNFIKGDCNQLARAAAMAVANNPGGTSFNPLVIYGGTGLGKTHLMHALGNHASAIGKAKRIAYISSEKFTVDFIDSVQSDTVNEFSTHYRSMDLLIVDDIQFFTGKEKTQDNFFHIFNTLYQTGKQIILSSDVPPKELKGLDERLISRFQCGLTADIQPPDLETRIAILQKKSEETAFELPPQVLEFIASNVTRNIRELEGCLISILARASLENRDINIDLAKDVLRVVVNEVRSPLSIEQIQTIVCDYFDIPVDLLRAKTRRQEVVLARQIAMYLSKEMTTSSLKTIGLHFGGRDHSTVIHACQVIEEYSKSDQTCKQHLERIRKKIDLNS
ncbi:MAG TPA: chromosomal replication initiator protein DnaA [Bacteroidota bacterium]|nr:chromosomal replication initiator protein DnaA [Bacteroidota bacterium]